MIQAPSAFVGFANLARLEAPFLWLLEIHNPQGGGLVNPDDPDGDRFIPRLTTASERVAHNKMADGTDQFWNPYPIEISDFEASAEGDLEGTTIALGNVFQGLLRYWEANDRLRDHRVLLHLVNYQTLSDPNARVTFRFLVTQSELDNSALIMRLATGAAGEQDIPLSVVTPTCRWRYRGEGCFFVGDPDDAELGPCALTREACRLRGAWELANGYAVIHPRQFGGVANVESA